MKTRLFTWLLCAAAAALIPAAPSTSALGTMTVVASCPTGTNWDAVRQMCV